MKLYKREDFIKLPKGTIYSRICESELMTGLFCKESGEEMNTDWVEQDLISEGGYPEDMTCGSDAHHFMMNKRDTFQHFETDLYCNGRDGLFDERDTFVVWDDNDVEKLVDRLLKSRYENK